MMMSRLGWLQLLSFPTPMGEYVDRVGPKNLPIQREAAFVYMYLCICMFLTSWCYNLFKNIAYIMYVYLEEDNLDFHVITRGFKLFLEALTLSRPMMRQFHNSCNVFFMGPGVKFVLVIKDAFL